MIGSAASCEVDKITSHAWAMFNPQKQHAEQVVLVFPALHELKTGFYGQASKTWKRIFVRVFRGDVLALLEAECV